MTGRFEPIKFDQLEAGLADLATSLAFPPTPDLASAVGVRLRAQATDPAAIQEHARRVGMPADGITQVVDTVIVRPDPTNV